LLFCSGTFLVHKTGPKKFRKVVNLKRVQSKYGLQDVSIQSFNCIVLSSAWAR
jgi:hypothetical protein